MKKILFILGLLLIPNFVFAKNLTKTDLEQAAVYLENYCYSEEAKEYSNSLGTCTISFSYNIQNDKIIVHFDGDEEDGTVDSDFEVAYTLGTDGKVNFSYVIPIENGLTEEQYDNLDEGSSVSAALSLLVAQASGAKVLDYTLYYLIVYFNEFPTITAPSTGGYIVVGDGVTVDNSDNQYAYVIHESEYGDYIVRMAEIDFGDEVSISDTKDDSEDRENYINSFVFNRTFTKTDDAHATLSYGLVMDANADYSSLKGLADFDEDITKPINPPTASDEGSGETQSKEENTKTGASLDIIFVALLGFWGLLLTFIYNKKKVVQRI